MQLPISGAPVITDADISLAQAGGHAISEGNCFITIMGMPRWSDDGLAKTALNLGPAKALKDGYDIYGANVLQRMRGVFSFAMVDRSHQTGFFAIDRMGVMPLYLTSGTRPLVFGSRTDAVAAHPAVDKSINIQALYEYLFFHMVPSPNTIYQQQQKLQPGHYAIYKNGTMSIQPYWQGHFREDHHLSKDALSAELKDILHNAVERCVSPGIHGAFLSGGLDSSTVAGILQEITGEARTYTIGFDADGYDETEYANLAANHFHTRHNEYFISPQDVVDAVPTIAATFDEPFGNSSAIPAYYCALLAKQDGAAYLMAGDGGDELFAGNERYATAQKFELYHTIPDALRQLLLEPLAFSVANSTEFMPVRKAQSYIRQAKIPLPERIHYYNFLYNEALDKVLHPDLLDVVDTHLPMSVLRDIYNAPKNATSLNRMLNLDWKITLADNDLRKVSRMCELAGIPVRYPMLDDDLVSFANRIPSKLKLNRSKLRYLYKYALRDFLPREIISKKKHGFGLPDGLWIKHYEPFRSLAYDSLASFKQRHLLRADYVDRLLHLHQTDNAAHYGKFIWVLMMLELWLQKNEH